MSDAQKTKFSVQKSIPYALVLTLLSASLLGWAFFYQVRVVLSYPVTSWISEETADCGIVLTGGPHRIREGVDLLSRRIVQKLIISGVNPQASLKEILPHWPLLGDVREEDIILERRSRSTYGNSQQTVPLVEALRCRDVLLITSRTHMHRALKTFKAEYPATITILPWATTSVHLRPAKWEIAVEAVKGIFYSLWAY